MSDDIRQDLIDMCRGLLERAESGEMTGLGFVEFKGKRINTQFRTRDFDEAMKMPAFMGAIVGTQFDWDMDDEETAP